MIKEFDQVIYMEGGKKYNATVLGVRALDHHTGANGEPHLHLGFFAPVEGRTVIGTQDQDKLAQFRLDVVHESHEFDEAAQKAGHKGSYPGGRWKERPVGKTKAPKPEETE